MNSGAGHIRIPWDSDADLENGMNDEPKTYQLRIGCLPASHAYPERNMLDDIFRDHRLVC